MTLSLSATLMATVHEIFSGIQGEGLQVGTRQVFVRFHGCSLSCRYCDTPASRGGWPHACDVEREAGLRVFDALPNPLSVDDLLDAIRRVHAGYPHHAVSLTGGEPLLHRAVLDALIPALHREGIRTYLETNGVLAEELLRLEEMPDFIAMDVKLPSAAGVALWDDHAAFLAAAAERLGAALPARLQVKMVFGAGSADDLVRAAQLVAARDHAIPGILQPVTPRPDGPLPPTPAETLEAQRLVAQHLADVRVIPQTHVMLGQR
jgi:organic radical activating enzyme